MEGFQQVRRRKPRKIIIGSSTSGGLSVAPKQGHIHIWRLATDTTISTLEKYIGNKTPSTKVECEQLNARGPYASFKITVDDSMMEELMNPEFWPTGTAIDRFLPRRPLPPRLT